MYGQRLKTLRKNRGLSKEEAAEMIDIPPSTLGNYESESKRPSLDRLIKLTKFYNTSLDYLVGLTEDPRPLDTQDERDAATYLNNQRLHWHGEPLSEAELRPIRDILENIVSRKTKEKEETT